MDDNVIDLQELQKKFNPRRIAIILIGILVIISLFSSFYIVDQQEEGVILRLGKYNRSTGPGLQFKLPFGIERNFNVAVRKDWAEEFGYRTIEPEVTSRFSTDSFADESWMLSGDLNIVDVKWVIRYKIVNAYDWLFNVQDQRKTIRDISQSVINQLVGDRTIFDVMRNERKNIEDISLVMMNKLFDSYKIGMRVESVKLLNIVPPVGTVQDAFEDVNKAMQDRNRSINEGKEAYNNAIPKARGVAKQTIQEAEGYAIEQVNLATGDVARFNAVLGQYQKNPRVIRQRLYYEIFEKILGNKESIELIDKRLKNFLPFKSVGAPNSTKEEEKK
jgi:membrane protease subunit HflK